MNYPSLGVIESLSEVDLAMGAFGMGAVEFRNFFK